MSEIVSELTKIRRKMASEIAFLAFEEKLNEEIDSIPRKITEAGFTNYRCCKYREQAILTERIKLMLGVDPGSVDQDKKLSEIVEEIKENGFSTSKDEYIRIIEEACDHCSIDKIVVTNACRNCVAHHCVNSCPRQAIQIVENRAFINREECVECGLCVDACSYGAILEIDRPCNRACEVGAIVPGKVSTVRINHEDCLECGLCISSCPFGAISYQSDFYKVIQLLKQKEKVSALIAPSFVGQFGHLVNFNKLKKGLIKLGFDSVYPVAVGAEMVIEDETREISQKSTSEKGREPTFNSCCPSFKALINKHYPQLKNHVSKLASPMIKTAELAQKKGSEKCVFIGPCLAKKGEKIRQGKELVEAVISFEELASLLVACEINLAEIEDSSAHQSRPSLKARKFCQNGGVKKSIQDRLKEKEEDLSIKTSSVSSITECIKLLEKLKQNDMDLAYIEGMACKDGCLGGPGTLVKAKISKNILQSLIEDTSQTDAN